LHAEANLTALCVRGVSGAAQVQQYILVTADHHHLDGDNDCDIFVDADLSILVRT
jgi:predicted metal-dependent HD superfamily phosphohydrolase